MSLTGGARHRCRTRRRMDTRLWRRSSGRTAPPSRAQRRRSCSARRQLRATSTAWCGSWPRGAISTCRTTTGGPHSISPPRKGTPRLFAGYCCTAPTPKPSIGSAARLWTTHIARTGTRCAKSSNKARRTPLAALPSPVLHHSSRLKRPQWSVQPRHRCHRSCRPQMSHRPSPSVRPHVMSNSS